MYQSYLVYDRYLQQYENSFLEIVTQKKLLGIIYIIQCNAVILDIKVYS